jgi:hypothetical protein
MDNIYQKVLNQVIFLYTKYSTEHRANTQPFHLQKIKNQFKNYKYDCKDLVVREPLIEHSGSLAIIATAIYPYIKNKKVDLGQALIMLAIHDIGELIVGDEITFTKKENKEEKIQALKLLPKQFHSIYLEMENRTSDTAKFAKAIDKIAPDIIDLIVPAEISVERFKILINKNPNEIVSMIKDFKHPYMIWNNFLKNFHLEILHQLDQKLKPYY